MKIYTFPFLIDLITFLVMLRLADAAGREMRLSNLQTSWLMVSFSACFLVTCLMVGRLLNTANARPILLVSIAALMALAAPLFFTTAFWPTLWLFSAYGVAVAAAFNSFQTFMRGQAAAGSLGLTVARYTISWGMGVACGFLLGGILKDLGGPVALAAFSTLACLSIIALVIMHDARDARGEQASTDAVVEEADGEADPRSRPVDGRYVVIGWLLSLSANFSQRPLTTFIPKFHAEHGSPAWAAGFLLCVLFLAQALSGYRCHRLRRWLYRLQPLVLVQLLLVAALALLWAAPGFAASLVVVLVLGVLFGFVFFSCVYYVSNDVRSSRNVGINEAMVGVGNILGVLVSESSMRLFRYPEAYFPVCMGATLLIIGMQWLWLKRSRPASALLMESP